KALSRSFRSAALLAARDDSAMPAANTIADRLDMFLDSGRERVADIVAPMSAWTPRRPASVEVVALKDGVDVIRRAFILDGMQAQVVDLACVANVGVMPFGIDKELHLVAGLDRNVNLVWSACREIGIDVRMDHAFGGDVRA
ncbi:MAG TPA: hypothetical protein VGT79_08510, partial [Xanthomonadaceae bacterium]|nr:hypothetical protein [Xanthomonadaceae bacterium]